MESNNWKQQVQGVRAAAEKRLRELELEMDEIVRSFPDLVSKPGKRGRRRRHTVHWMKRPENASRARAVLERLHAGLERKLSE